MMTHIRKLAVMLCALPLSLTVVIVVASSSAVAEDLDNWVIGKWAGILTLTNNRGESPTVFKATFKEGGVFEGYAQGRSGVTDYRSGTWKIEQATITVQYIVDNPRSAVNGAKETWSLRREGDELVGRASGTKEGANLQWQFDVKTQKSK